MDGLTCVRKLRAMPDGDRLKVLMCTQENSLAHINLALAFGVDEYIMKPFNLDILSDKLTHSGVPPRHRAPEEANAVVDHAASWKRLSFAALAGMAVAEREVRLFNPDDVIYRKGDRRAYGYIVLSGAVELFAERDGRPLPLATLRPYQQFGEVSLDVSVPRRVTARAKGPTELMLLSAELFRARLDRLSPFMRCWVESLGSAVDNLLNLAESSAALRSGS
jgi:CRP-like cAMP-binding protein